MVRSWSCRKISKVDNSAPSTLQAWVLAFSSNMEVGKLGREGEEIAEGPTARFSSTPSSYSCKPRPFNCFVSPPSSHV